MVACAGPLRRCSVARAGDGCRQPPAELQWQSDVLRDPELGPALPLVGSQFDLVQCLPLVGRAVRLKRYDGSLQDPWLVQVRALPMGFWVGKAAESIDVSLILVSNMFLIQILIGTV